MYPPKAAPPVRPRSSLSTDENHRMNHRHTKANYRKRPSKALLTLAGFCIFLFVLCVFLLGALVYVGRTMAEEKTSSRPYINLTDANGGIAYAIPAADGLNYLSKNQLLHFAIENTSPVVPYNSSTTLSTSQIKSHLSADIMSKSKILQNLTFRLPKEIRPKKYKLLLNPDLSNKTFSGNIDIHFEVLKPISYVPVHSKLLNVTTNKVAQLGDNGTTNEAIEHSLTFNYPDYEYWVTEFKEPLPIGNYLLSLSFNGSLANRIVGLYQSSYLDKKQNIKRSIAATKFEPTFARQAFPCFDEPALKAPFEITVVRPKGDGYHVLSNMPIEEEEEVGNNVEVHFQETVPMSTYLACVIVSDLTSKSKEVHSVIPDSDNFTMRVFSTAAQENKVTYALDIGVKIIEHYISYFNIPYPLPKLDMAAIPEFVSGAMENWGLVTYRETTLLYDETISSSANKQRVAEVIAHELAHMWFGNLVTMKWWNDLWLNEGFASYIEYKGVDSVHPEWERSDQFLVQDLHSVLKIDSNLASHPIVQTVENPNQITELFDTITYSKGASIIRMLENVIGEEKFRNATTNYLNSFIYSNAETDDFLTKIEEEEIDDIDIKLFMKTWTEQMGFPVVEVTKDGNNYRLTQKRFLSNPEDYDVITNDSDFNYRWTIVITYFTSDDPTVKRTVFNYNDNEVTITVPSSVEWIKFNKNQYGYYRVNYPQEMWQSLISVLNTNRGLLSASDRGHLINDACVLADASQLPYGVALNLLSYLKNELNYVPWRVGLLQLSSIRNLLYYTNLYRDFVTFGRDLIANIYNAVTWNVGTDHLFNLLRVDVLNMACAYGYEPALTEVANRFKVFMEDTNVRPHPDIRSTVYSYGMKTVGNEMYWNQMWDLFVQEQDANEKVKLMNALANVQVPWLLNRYINLASNESYVRSQDYFPCLEAISNNRIGQSLVWEYVRENWPKLVQRFGINERKLGRLIPSITGRFTTQTKLDEMNYFFNKYPEAGAGTAARKEALETVKYNIKWLKENTAEISTWLEANVKTK